MKLTTKEASILWHRLYAADALVECLTDTHPDDSPSPWSTDRVQEAVESVEERLKAGRWQGLDDCEKAVLKDCVEGSTVLACDESAFDGGVITRQQLAATERVLYSLGEKVAALIGCEVRVPRC